GGLIGVGRAGIGGTVTLRGDVARVRRRAADCRALLIGRAGRARAGAVLRRIADAGRGAALHGRRLEGVHRTGVVHAVAALGHVAGAGARAAHRRALRIGRARRIRPGAGLRRVARAGRRPALHRRRLQGIGRAVDARPRTCLGHVADVGRRAALGARGGGRVDAPPAPVALVRAADVAVVRAGGAARRRRAGALPGLTAVHRRAPAAVVARGAVGHGRAGAGVLVVAGRAVGLEGVGRTGGVRPGARLGHVARARRRAARGPGGLEAVSGAVVAHAIAALGHVAGTGRRAADRRALRIRRTG